MVGLKNSRDCNRPFYHVGCHPELGQVSLEMLNRIDALDAVAERLGV